MCLSERNLKQLADKATITDSVIFRHQFDKNFHDVGQNKRNDLNKTT